MGRFSQGEIEYLKSQRLGRLATVNIAGEPHVVPVGFRYNPELETIDIGGHGIGNSKKFREAAGKPVAFVVDDVLPPWQPRYLEIRGRGEALASGGKDIMSSFDDELIRITPTHIVSGGIDTDAHQPHSRKVE